MFLLGAVNLFSPNNTFHANISALGKKLLLRTSTNPNVATTMTGGATFFSAPDISPAYLGVGYIIGPRLAALNFAGGVLAWGLLVPLLTFTVGPYIQAAQPAGQPLSWPLLAGAVYYSIVRPIAVGGMLVGATIHLVPDAQAVGHGHGPGHLRPEKVRRSARSDGSHRARSAGKGSLRGSGRRVRGHDSALSLLHRQRRGLLCFQGADRRTGCRWCHDRHRILLCGRVRKSGRNDRLIEQSGIGTYPLYPGDRRAADGGSWSFRRRRRCCGAGSGRGGLRFLGRCRRDAAGPESGTHPRRNALQDADRRSARDRDGLAGVVLSPGRAR